MQERQVLEVNPESEDVTLATFSKPSTSKVFKSFIQTFHIINYQNVSGNED